MDRRCTDGWKELLSFKCDVTGIMFYEGRKGLHSLMKVKLVREPYSRHDQNAIMVLAAGQQLGYVQRSTACYLAPVMDKYKDELLYMG